VVSNRISRKFGPEEVLSKLRGDLNAIENLNVLWKKAGLKHK
jgi:hypothetical protein